MVDDALFEDGGAQPLRLQAQDVDDLSVLSALLQDAIFPITEMSWQPSQQRFGLLLNRFRWEDATAAERRNRAFERVQAMLVIGSVLSVASNGIDRSDREMILSMLAMNFTPTSDGAGRLEIVLAGDGAIALEIECIDINLKDVTRPYKAPSGHAPSHKLED